jgi:hypothetical protein
MPQYMKYHPLLICLHSIKGRIFKNHGDVASVSKCSTEWYNVAEGGEIFTFKG